MDYQSPILRRNLLLIGIILLIITTVFLFLRWKRQLEPLAAPESRGTIGGLTTSPTQTRGLPTAAPAAPRAPQGAPPAVLPSKLPRGEEIILYDPARFTASDPPSGGIVTYHRDEGRFARIGPQGTAINLTNDRFYNVRNVTWSNDRTSAVIEEQNGTKTIYNFSTKERYQTPSQWEQFSFAPNNQEVAFKNLSGSPQTQWMAAVNVKTGALKLLMPLADQQHRVKVSWSPADGSIGFVTEPINATTQILSLIQKDGTRQGIGTINGVFFEPLWSPNGKWLLFSTADTKREFAPMLWIAIGSGENVGAMQQLPLPTTVEQCTFTPVITTIICSVPIQGAIANYGSIRGDIPDVAHHIVALDLATNIPRVLYTPATPSSLTHPIVGNKGKMLYFTNQTSGTLEAIPLKLDKRQDDNQQ